MKRYLALILFSPLILAAQSDLSGVVTDNDGHPIPGVSVHLLNPDRGTITQPDGKFAFTSLDEGDYHLKFSAVGFASRELRVNHQNFSPTILIRLEDDIKELESVEVHASSEVRAKKLSGFNVSMISLENFHDLNLDVNQILGMMSGINIREKGGLGSGFDLSLNGLSGNQVRYFVDGIPIEYYGSALSFNNLPANLMKSVEIYKGVAPVDLTTDALGGVININTPDRKEDFLDASYSVGSFNTHRASLFAQKATSGGIFMRVTSFFNHSDNSYRMDRVPATDEFGNIRGYQSVRRFHDAYTSGSVGAQVGLLDQKFADELVFGFTYAGNSNEIQHPDVSINRVYGGLASENESTIATLNHSKSWNRLKTKNDAVAGRVRETYYDTLTQRFNWQGQARELQTAEYFSEPSIRVLTDDFLWYRSSLSYQFNPQHEFVGQFSMNYLRRNGQDKINVRANELFVPNYLNKNFAGLSYNFTSKNESIRASLFSKQYWYEAEIHTEEYLGDGTELVETATGLSRTGYGVAISYAINRTFLVKSSYEYAYRLPEAHEIMGNGLLVLPNPDLKPENSHNINLGVLYNPEISTGKLRSEWNVFYRPTQDKIWSVAQGVLSTNRNVSNTRVIGAESSNRWVLNNNYTLSLNLTWQSHTDQRRYNEGLPNTNFGERMPNDPYFFGDFGFQYRFNLKSARITASWNTRYVHEFFLYAEGNGNLSRKRSIPTQFLNDMNVSCMLGEGKYNLSFSINNVFDAEAYDNWSLQKPGRAFNLKLRYFINKL